jgi:hypothetical protein
MGRRFSTGARGTAIALGAGLWEDAVLSCSYNGWTDAPEEEREALDAYEGATPARPPRQEGAGRTWGEPRQRTAAPPAPAGNPPSNVARGER